MKKIITSILLGTGLLAFNNNASAQNYNITFAAQLPYGSETLANICGYSANGQEYALVGAAQGMSIVNVTTPTNPVVITQIPNVDNLWKEIKVFQNYAYVTTEGGGGLQIVDLTNLPATNLSYHSYTGDGAINGQLNTIHALHIDTTKKFIYLYGTNLFNGGAVILDINTDPYNPTYAGNYTHPQHNYIHDGYVDNDTIYASHIYDGVFSVADVSNKSNPVVLAEQQTPTAFTHNTWLSNDRDFIFTTDENSGSYLAAYDVSDLNNITETDRMQTTPGSGSVVHNTHILNNWAITSWYKDGINIVDVTRPNNLVEVGRYDTYATGGNGFEGAWGVYPYLPSGTLIVSNIDEGLFVLSPTYVRACYLEGTVIDSVCGTPLNDVIVTISSVNVTDSSDLAGIFATGTAVPGTYNVTFSKAGYNSKTYFNVNFTAAVVTTLNVELYSPSSLAITGSVTDAATTNGMANLPVTFSGVTDYSFTTDGSGNFNSCSVVGGTYTVSAGAWGYETVCNPVTVNSGSPTVSLALGKEYYDDFSFNLGWTISSTSTSGFWERGIPNGTFNGPTPSNPGADVTTDCSEEAYVTGNTAGSASQDDVDQGATVLTSPVFDLSGYGDAWIHYDRWFYNGGGSGGANDTLTLSLTNGTQTVVIETVTAATTGNSTWKHSAKKVSQFLTPGTNMQFIARAVDAGAGHLVEAGLDKWFVVDSSAAAIHEQPANMVSVAAFPNPFTNEITVEWDLHEYGAQNAQMILTDVSGRLIKNISLSSPKGKVILEENLAEGIYFIRVMQSGKSSKTIKLIKL